MLMEIQRGSSVRRGEPQEDGTELSSDFELSIPVSEAAARQSGDGDFRPQTFEAVDHMTAVRLLIREGRSNRSS